MAPANTIRLSTDMTEQSHGEPSETKVRALRSQAKVLRHQAQNSKLLSNKSKSKAAYSAMQKERAATEMAKQLENQSTDSNQ